MTRLVAPVLMSLVSLVLATPVAAQRATGAIEGVVIDETARPLESVMIVVLNDGTGLRRTTTTGADGRYVVPSLPVEGTYTVRAELTAFGPSVRTNVSLASNQTIIIDFRMRVAVDQEINVVGTPVLDLGRSSVQQTVNEPLVRALPLLGRNFIQLASLTAGFTGNPNLPNPQGQAYWTNNVLVDGASHFSKWRSAPRTFYSGYGLESIKEVQVLANRFSAEFGEALATITSVVTKAGTNEHSGSALFFFQDDALNATPAFAVEKPPSGSQQFGFTFGGPFVRDRTHFLGSYEGRRSRVQNIVVSPVAQGKTAPDREDEHLFFFRVDHQMGRHLGTVRYNGQAFAWHNEPGGLTLPGTGTKYNNDVNTFLFTDTSQLSNRLLNEVRVQFARYADTRLDIQPGVYVLRSGYSIEGGTLGRFGFGADPEDTWELADTITSSQGSRVIKFGGGFKYVRAHNAFMNYGRGAYFFAGPPDLYPSAFLFSQGLAADEAAATADPRSKSIFTFVQADWKVRPGLTLNLGLRYDLESISNVSNYSVPADKNNVQPRLGAAWDPDGSGRMVVRGGLGLYTQQHLLFYINRVELEGANGTSTVSIAPGEPQFPAFPNVLSPGGSTILPPRDIHQADSTFHNPYSLQATVGVERAIAGHIVISADYVYLNGRSLMSLIDANAPASNQKPNVRTVAEADLTRPLFPVPGGFRKILTLGNQGESWYHALQIRANRTTGRLQTVASYTLAHAEDMANYELPEDSRNIQAEKARASTDIRHNFSVGFTWDLPPEGWLRDWSLSGIGIFRSNRPYTTTWGDDRNGTTQNDARPDGRNTARTEGFHNVDLAVARRFRWGTRTIDARFEMFNVFNTLNYNEYVGTLSSPLYTKPVSAFPKERIQLAAIVRF